MRQQILCAVLAVAAAPPLAAQAMRHEIGLTLGAAVTPGSGSGAAAVGSGAGRALEANYGIRLRNGAAAALFGEVHFLASPLREVTAGPGAATRDFASLYVTPGVRVKFRPAARFAPYVAFGGGYALYEQSLTTRGGQSNAAARLVHRGALQWGAGLDVRLWRFGGARLEVRDFYTGRPAYNVAVPGGQHNVVAGGGLLLELGGRE